MKLITILSNDGNVGKSFFALNLARLFFSFGKKVLVIDFDFYKDGLKSFLNLNSHDIFQSILAIENENHQERKKKAPVQKEKRIETFNEYIVKINGVDFLCCTKKNSDLSQFFFFEDHPNETLLKNLQLFFTSYHDYDYIIVDTTSGKNILNTYLAALATSNVYLSFCDIANLQQNDLLRKYIYSLRENIWQSSNKKVREMFPFFRRTPHTFLTIQFCNDFDIPPYQYYQNFVDYSVFPYELNVQLAYKNRQDLIPRDVFTSYQVNTKQIKSFYLLSLFECFFSILGSISRKMLPSINKKDILQNIRQAASHEEQKNLHYFREDIKQKSEQIASLNGIIDGLDNSLADASDRYNMLNSQMIEITNSKNVYLAKLDTEIVRNVNAVKDYEAQISRLEKEKKAKIDELQNVLTINQETLFRIREEKEQLLEEKKILTSKLDLEKESREKEQFRNEEKIEKLDSDLAKQKALFIDKSKELEQTEQNLQKQLQLKTTEIEDLILEIDKLKKRIGEKNLLKIEDLEEKTKIAEDTAKTSQENMREAQQKVDKIEADCKTLQQQLEQIKEQLDIKTKKLDTTEKKVHLYEDKVNNILVDLAKSNEIELPSLEEKNIEAIQQMCKNISKIIFEHKNEIQKYREAFANSPYNLDPTGFPKFKEDLTSLFKLKKNMAGITFSIDQFPQQFKEIQRKASDHAKAKGKLEEEKSELENILDVTNGLVREQTDEIKQMREALKKTDDRFSESGSWNPFKGKK